jgi:hypothetical protein
VLQALNRRRDPVPQILQMLLGELPHGGHGNVGLLPHAYHGQSRLARAEEEAFQIVQTGLDLLTLWRCGSRQAIGEQFRGDDQFFQRAIAAIEL